jgi:hypothetical protein
MPRLTTPEGAVQAAVIDYLARLELQGKLMFWRSNNVGIWDARKQCYRKPSGPGHRNGVPDITVILSGGRYVGLECKAPKGTQSDAQRGVERDIKRLGGSYYVVWSLDEAISALSLELSPSRKNADTAS